MPAVFALALHAHDLLCLPLAAPKPEQPDHPRTTSAFAIRMPSPPFVPGLRPVPTGLPAPPRKKR